jgi:uncharacterized protein involved in response to NO
MDSLMHRAAAIPRYRPQAGATILSAGFRPFFLAAAIWAALALPLWLAAYAGALVVPTALSPLVWHIHEMVFGFAAASVAGFLLTAIPNWTGRMPLQGGPLAALVLLWAIGRLGVLFSAVIGPLAAAIADLSFPAVFLAVIAREIAAGRNWRNLPMVAGLSLLLAGNLLVHLDALDIADTAMLGNRIGIATLLMQIALIGGRIIPSFTRNWLAKTHPELAPPSPEGRLDRLALAATALALAVWVAAPEGALLPYVATAAGAALSLRLMRWRGLSTLREPLLFILHVGYGWLAFGLLLLGVTGFWPFLPPSAVLHVLTVGAIGTMTLAVMTRATLGHTGRPLSAGPGTQMIYVLVTLAALLRPAAALAGDDMQLLALAGAAWTGAFGLFAVLYGGALIRPKLSGKPARPQP